MINANLHLTLDRAEVQIVQKLRRVHFTDCTMHTLAKSGQYCLKCYKPFKYDPRA